MKKVVNYQKRIYACQCGCGFHYKKVEIENTIKGNIVKIKLECEDEECGNSPTIEVLVEKGHCFIDTYYLRWSE